MSDYIPTTAEVRMYYKHPEGSKIAWRVTPVEFDRWLAEMKAEAWEEGERRGRDNEQALMMCQAQHRPSSSAVLAKNPYREEN